ncbi:MAG: CYTH domain-containing protein [Nitrospirae bacterium]|nr:CYTH domain-containing protein [Nitrospirota bacterium]
MDYLIRDSYFTGVPYGKIDLSRLINALTLTVSDNQYYVCVQEKYLPTIEDYVLARYQMHNGIYLHDFKCEMELILKKILYRAFELYKGNNLKRDNLPIAIIKTFEGQDMTVSDYVSLDDSVMLALFLNWKNGSDSLLSTLCTTLLDRNKYKQIMILDNTDADIGEFKQKLKDLLLNNGYEVADYGREYFWLEDSVENNVYKKSKKNIWILKNDGSLKDLMDVSALITDKLDEKKNIVFINIDVLKQNNKIQNIENVIDDINNLIRLFNRRNQIEIEKKYAFKDHQLFKKVEDGIRELGNYNISNIEPSYRQVDVYYDTADELLNKAGITLRIRKRNGKTILTIKTPTVNSVGKESREGQNERFEYEKELITDSLEEAKDHITKCIPALLAPSKFSHLEPRMTIKNSRKKIKLTDQNIKFEMVFDDVQYERNGKSAHEYQIEIELKSDFIHRINLKMLTDYLEKNVPNLIPATVSKYRRGLSLTD